MNIQNISKENREAVIKLNADELVAICNAMYSCKTQKDMQGDLFYRLYSDMMITRDICQYGHIDQFCLDRINDCRSKIQNK